MLSGATGPSKTVFPHSYLTHSLLLCWTDLFFSSVTVPLAFLLSSNFNQLSAMDISRQRFTHIHMQSSLDWFISFIYHMQIMGCLEMDFFLLPASTGMNTDVGTKARLKREGEHILYLVFFIH